jgi:cytochrome c
MSRSIFGHALMAFGVAAVSSSGVCADDLAAARELTVSHCGTCHTFGASEPHGQGPNLHGIMGREAGAVFGFNFSWGFMDALKGKTWNADLMDRWLADTLAVAPGTGMVYWQDDPARRAAMVRYLESLR